MDSEDFSLILRGRPGGQHGDDERENCHHRGELRPIARHPGHELPPVAKDSPGTHVVAGDMEANRVRIHCQSAMKMERQEMTLTAVPTSAHPYIQAAMSIGRLTQPWLIGVPKFECQ